MTIKIDKEFEQLLPPLSEGDLEALEESLLEEGCRDPLILWNGIVVDGHNRYRLCTKHSLPFKTVEREFKDRDDAKLWILKNQLARRNVSDFQRIEIVSKIKPLIAARAKERQESGKGADGSGGRGKRKNLCQKSDKGFDTKKEAAALAGVSHDTFHKGETILKSDKVDQETKDKLRRGEKGVSINKVYNELKRKKKEDSGSSSPPSPPKASEPDEDYGKPTRYANNEWRQGMMYAKAAILTLSKIRDDDLERQQAFDHVISWIGEHR